MSKNKTNKSTKNVNKEQHITDETEINNVLLTIGKRSRNPGVKELTKNFVGKIKSKTDNDSEGSVKSTKSVKSVKSVKSSGKAQKESSKKNTKEQKGPDGKYSRPKSTFTDNLTKEEVEKKLEDYKKVDDISAVPIGTHLRYFIKKDGELVFRMGGNLKINTGLPKYVILVNAEGVQWTVQVEGTIFYKKMSLEEIKEEYESIIKELNGKIKKLKERIKELEN